jgi:tetratricopeptide (TPR) repeat protein
MTEGRRWLTDALTATSGVDVRTLAKAYFAAGYAALGQGDYAQAKPHFEESLTLARQAGDARAEAAALAQLAWVVMTRGAYEEDHTERAVQLATKALELARGLDDRLTASGALNTLADIAAQRGDDAGATRLYEESLALRRGLGDKRLVANSVLTLGRAELLRGNMERATTLLNEGYALARDVRDTWSMSVALVNLGRVQLHSGDADRAQGFFRDGLALARDRGDKRVAAECLQGLAAVLGVKGQEPSSARLFGAAEALLEAIGATPSPAEETIRTTFVPSVQAAIGEEAFAAAQSAGRLLAPEEAIALALEATAASGALAPSPS